MAGFDLNKFRQQYGGTQQSSQSQQDWSDYINGTQRLDSSSLDSFREEFYRPNTPGVSTTLTEEGMQQAAETAKLKHERHKMQEEWADYTRGRGNPSYLREGMAEGSYQAGMAAANDQRTKAQKRIDSLLGVDSSKVTGKKTDWGEIIKGTMYKGADQFSTSVAGGLNWLFGDAAEQIHSLGVETINGIIGGVNSLTGANIKPVENNGNLLTNWYETLKETKAHNEQVFSANANTSKAAQIVDNFGTSFVAAVPMALEALMTAPYAAAKAGATATTAGLQYVSGLQSAHGMQAAGMMARQSLNKMLQNPQFWSSYVQAIGDSSETAAESGMSPRDAAIYTMINSFFNAAIEVGGGDETLGGIQNFPMRLQQLEAQGGKKAVVEWFKDSVLGEGLEEVAQGVFERGVKAPATGARIASLDPNDTEAIINPWTSAQEYTGGAVVGGLLGGGQIAVQNSMQTIQGNRAFEGDSQALLDSAKKSGGEAYTKAIEQIEQSAKRDANGAVQLNRDQAAQLYDIIRNQGEIGKYQEAVQQKQSGQLLTRVFSDAGIDLTEDEQAKLTGLVNEGGAGVTDRILGMRDAYKAGESGQKLADVMLEMEGRGLTYNQISRAWAAGANVQTDMTGPVDVNTEEGRATLEASLAPLGTHIDAAVNAYDGKQDAARYSAAMQKAAFLYAANGADLAKIVQDARDGKVADIVGYLNDEQVKLAQEIGNEQRAQIRETEQKAAAATQQVQEQAAAITKGQTVTAQALAEMDTAIDVANRASQRAADTINQTVASLEAMVKANPKAAQSEAYKKAYDAAMQQKKKIEGLQKTVTELRRRKAELEGRKTIQRKKGTVSYSGGTVAGVKYDGVDQTKLTRQQQKVVAMVERLADAVNLDYVFISADPGMGGAYVKGGTVYVNINAGMGVGSFSQTMAAASLSHELTHWMQDYAPEQYRELKDFIVSEVLKADPQELNRLVQQQQRWEKGRSLSYEQALDEVVANACQTMLLDSKAIAKLARQNMTLAERIKDFIEDWSNKIKEAFAEVDTSQGSIYDSLRAVEGSLDRIQELWDEGIEAAAQSYNAEQTVGKPHNALSTHSNALDALQNTDTNENAAPESDAQKQAWNPLEFGEEVQQWYDSRTSEERRKDTGFFRVGTTSEPLKSIGVKAGTLIWGKGKMEKILLDHEGEGIDLDVIKQVPDITERPVFVLKSKTVPGSIVLFGTVETKTGRKMLATVSLTPGMGKNLNVDLSVITGAYSRRNNQMRNMLMSSEILYIDGSEGNERTNEWLKQIGLQLPSRTPNVGSIGSITYTTDGVKISGKTWKELFGEAELESKTQFQMLSDVEETNRLVAVHNVTEEKLLPALKLGGLPVPSIAIVKAKSGHSNYGPISLVFAKKTIDPQADRRNKVYGADAWTPMRADVEYQVNDDEVLKAEQMISSLSSQIAGGIFSSGSALRQYGIEGKTALDYEGMLQKISASDAAKAAYAAAHGIDVEPVYRQKEFSVYGNDALQSYIDRVGSDTVRRLEEQLENGEWDLKDEDMQALKDALREHFLSKFAKPSVAERRAANIANNDRYVKFINGAYAYLTSSGEATDEVDRLATGDKLSEAVSSKDVVEWLRPQLTEIIGEPGIRNRTDAYTADGRRRSFWQTHDAYTLANIVKAMTSGNARGAGIHLGATHLQSITAKDYSNVESMKKDAGRMRRTTEEEYSAEVSAVDDQLQKLVNDIAAFNKDDSYMGKDTIGEVLIEAARGKQTVAGIQQSFKRLSEYTLSKELAEQVLSAYQAAANLPTEYFEAKPQRAVGFDEVLSAIIPDNASPTLKAALQRAGVHVDEYKTGDEQDRIQKLNSVEGAQFQRWDDTDGDTAAERNGREQSYARLQSENKILSNTIKGLNKLIAKKDTTIGQLQDRLKLNKTPEVREADAKKLARQLLREHNSIADFEGLAADIKALGDYLVQAKEVSEDEVKSRARNIAAEILENATEQYHMEDEQLDTVRGEIKGRKLTISPDFLGELDQAGGYDLFRKQNFGKFTLARSDSKTINRDDYMSVSQFYADMQNQYGKTYFPDAANEGEEAIILASVMQAAAPMEVNPYRQYMGEATEELANRITRDALNGILRLEPDRYADVEYLKEKSRNEALNARVKQLVEENALSKEEAGKLWQQVQELNTQLEHADMQYRALEKAAENRIAQVRAEGAAREIEIKAKERERAAKSIQALKDHYKEIQQNARERREESAGATKYRKQVLQKAGKLREMLLKNDDKLHVPEVLKEPLAAFLESLDFTSKRALRGGAETNADRAFAANLQKIQQILANQQDYINGGDMQQDLGGYIDVSPDSMEFLRRVSEMITTALSDNREYTINQMSAAELKDLANFLSNLRTAIKGMNYFMANARFESVREAASQDIQTIQELGRVGTTENGKLFHAAAWENGTPYYIFRRFGEGGKAIFDSLTRGWEKMALNVKEIMDFTEKAYTDKEVRAWQKETHAITLEDSTEITMTTAQIMELSMLLNREQAVKHLSKGGMRIGDIEGKKGVTTDTRHHHLTDADIKGIVGLLTPRQAQVAKALQTFMSVKGAEWGNEISMRRFGYRFYTEGANYYPIKTDSNDRPMSDTDAQQNSMFRLLNLSASKSLNPKASNALIVGDIFDTFANHTSDMAKLNGMGLPILDAIKWFNFKERIDLSDGGYDTRTMQGAMEEAFGKQALSYFRTLMKDINGVTESGDRGTGFWSKLLSNYKAAAVGANLRVAFLQPTSYVRASYLIKPQYLLQAFTNKNAYKEAMANSGTAVWKSLGYYDTNIARGMRDQIKHNEGWRDKVVEKSMALAELGDKRTWGRLWVACKMQAAAETGKTGDALIQATADLFREVIYSSQVMDSTLTRSELMRGKSQYTKALTAFMAEPTLSYNMVMDAAMEYNMNAKRYGKGEAWKRSRGYISKAVSVYVCSAAFSAVVESIADAFRDDDDEEDFFLKWSQAMFGEGNLLSGNLAQDLSLFGKLPYIKNLMSALQGYKNKDMSTAALDSILDTYKIWKETIDLATGELDKPTKTTYYGNMTTWGKIYKTLQGISQLSGIAVANMTRDVSALWNTTVGAMYPELKVKTYDPGPKKAIQDAYTSGRMSEEDAIQKLLESGTVEDEDKAYWTVRDLEGEDKYSQLKEAALNGDADTVKQELEQLTAHGVKEKTAISNLKSFLKKAYTGEELDKAESKILGDRQLTDSDVQKILTQFGGMDDNEAYLTVKGWETGDSGKYIAAQRAAFTGDQAAFKAEMQDLASHGVKEKDVRSAVKAFVRDAFMGKELSEEQSEIVGDHQLTEADARKMLHYYAGLSVDDANKAVAEWKEDMRIAEKYGAEYEKYDLTTAQAKYFYEGDAKGKVTLDDYAKQLESYGMDRVKAYYGTDGWRQTGLTMDQYDKYATEAAKCKGVDNDGDGKADANSVKNQKLAIINSLPVSTAVKDAIYRKNNWAESGLKNTPWH